MPNRAFYGHCLREIFACNHIAALQSGLTSHVSRNKPGGLTWGIILRRMQHTTGELGSVVP
jgi:hypothetical protein